MLDAHDGEEDHQDQEEHCYHVYSSHYHHELVHDLLLGCFPIHQIGIAIGAIDGGAWVH